MDGYRRSLRYAGVVLIAAGLYDVAHMVYVMATAGRLQSSFGVFLLIPGIPLFRGSLRAAWWVAFLAAGNLGVAIGLAGLLVSTVASGLLVSAFRSYPVLMIKHTLLLLLCLGVTVWVLVQVTGASVVREAERRESSGQRSGRVSPRYGFIAGVALSAVMLVWLISFLRSDGAKRAEIEAARKTGPGYRYVAYQLFWESAGGRKVNGAKVIAYNWREAREVEVRWEK